MNLLRLALLLVLLPPVGRLVAAETSYGPRLGQPSTSQWEAGLVITAAAGPCKGITASRPIPLDWPEQQVRIVQEQSSPTVRKQSFRLLDGARQLVLDVPQLASGQTAQAVVHLEIARRPILPPADPAVYRFPTKSSRVRGYLTESPYIESRHPKIRAAARDALADQEGQPAWRQVEAVYDWVRARVRYEEGPIRGALAALEQGSGDCEDMSSLFIALCRTSGIPARTVWVPGHCYPEFYLEDPSGAGHWFPCQAAGDRAFGEMAELRPILQKGDNFRLPETPRERKRYVSEFLRAASGRPSLESIWRSAELGVRSAE